MIHLNKGDAAHEWLSEEQLKQKYPDLHAKMHRPRPYAELGFRLKAQRLKHRITLLEFSRRVGLSAQQISAYERGYEFASIDVVMKYDELDGE